MIALLAGMAGCGDGSESHTLTIDGTTGGMITVDNVTISGKAMFTYDAGTVISLAATPSPDYRFVNWIGDVGTVANVNSASTTIAMQGNYEITANFAAILHSTYKLICDVPEVIVAGEETRIPMTLKTDELGELGYGGVQLHVKVYPRAGDVTIKLYFWSFSNELYSGEFDLPADYKLTIYPLVYFSEPGEYAFTFSLIEALYGPVINDMTESVTVTVVEAEEVEEAVGGCFIATAAYGTPMAEEIEILREFRDEYMLTNVVGQAFVDLYYRVSPPMADFITEHASLKQMVRAGLVPAVAMSAVVVSTTPVEKAAIASLLVLPSLALVVWAATRRERGEGHA